MRERKGERESERPTKRVIQRVRVRERVCQETLKIFVRLIFRSQCTGNETTPLYEYII